MPNVPLAPTPVVPDPLPEETEENRPFRDGLAAAYDDEAIASSDYYAHDEDESAANADRKKASEVAGGILAKMRLCRPIPQEERLHITIPYAKR